MTPSQKDEGSETCAACFRSHRGVSAKTLTHRPQPLPLHCLAAPPTPGSQAPPMAGCRLGRAPGQAMGWGVDVKDPRWSTVWVWSSLPRDCLGGLCLALRSRKLLNPAQPTKGGPQRWGRGGGHWEVGGSLPRTHSGHLLGRPLGQLPLSAVGLPAPFYFLSLCPKAWGRVRPAQPTPGHWVRCPAWLHPQGP